MAVQSAPGEEAEIHEAEGSIVKPGPRRPFLPGFVTPAFAASAVGMPLVLFLPEYYTVRLGFDLIVVGQTLLAVRLVDIAFEPAAGWAIDRMMARGVGLRRWLLAATPVLAASMAALFLAPYGVGPLWLLLWLMAAFLAHSVYSLAHLAWGTRLARDQRARSRILGWCQAAATLGQLTILLAPTLAAYLTGGDHGSSMHALGWLLVAGVPLATGAALLSAGEGVTVARRDAQPRPNILLLLRQRPVLTLLIIDLLMGSALAINASTAFFYLIGQLGFSRAQAGSLSAISLCAALAGLPLLHLQAQKRGKTFVLAMGAALYAGVQLLLMLAPQGAFWWAVMTAVTAGLLAPVAVLLPRLIVAEFAAAEKSRTGIDNIAFLLAIFSSTEKAGTAIAAGLILIGLGWAGFDPADTSLGEFEWLLRLAAAGLPALLFLAAAALAWKWPHAPPSSIRSESLR